MTDAVNGLTFLWYPRIPLEVLTIRRSFLSGAFVCTVVAAACGGQTAVPSPSASALATAAPAPAKLTVSYSNIVGDELPLWIAKEGGYFEKVGLNVDLLNIASAQGVPALIAGDVQIAQLGGSEVLSAAAEGADVAVIGMLAGVYPFVFEVSANIRTPADLKGRKVGVSSFGSSSDIATRVGLRGIGLDPDKDVNIVPVGSASQRTAALLSGAIDAGVAQPPEQLALEKAGFHQLFDLAALRLPSANTSVAVKRAYLSANRDVVQRYVDALVRAIVREKADKAFSIQVLKKYYKSDDDAAMTAAYDFFSLRVAVSLPHATPPQFADAQATLGAKSDKVKNFDVTRLIDDSFVSDAGKRGLDIGK